MDKSPHVHTVCIIHTTIVKTANDVFIDSNPTTVCALHTYYEVAAEEMLYISEDPLEAHNTLEIRTPGPAEDYATVERLERK